MAVPKRTRYEVLRRDDFKCRYCGLAGPEGAGLTVDHVVPVSLGGSDEPSNLVAACKDCNAGKASSSPDAPLVAQVSDDAIRWAAAMKTAAEALLAKHADLKGREDRFLSEWERWDEGLHHLPAGFGNSIELWLKAGLPGEILLRDVEKAWSNLKVPPKHVFRYMAGIAWSQVTEMQEAARAVVAPQPKTEPPSSGCAVCWWAADEDEDATQCPYVRGEFPDTYDWCGKPDCVTCHAMYHGYEEALPEGHEAGYRAGSEAAYANAVDDHQRDLMPGALLRAHIDGRLRKHGPAFILGVPGMDVPLIVSPAPLDPWAMALPADDRETVSGL